MKCFISYRHDDSRAITERIYDRLSNYFGKDSFFKDIDDLPPAANFKEKLEHSLTASSVLMAVIGKNWAKVVDAEGRRRLENSNDYVRFELETALRLDIPIIPVLVDNANMPEAKELPSTIQELTVRQGVVVRHDPDFHRDVERLILFLTEFLVDEIITQDEIQRKSLETQIPTPIQLPPMKRLIDSLSQRIQLNKFDFDALLKRGQIGYISGEMSGGIGLRQAFDDFRKVIRINPEVADAHFGLGCVYRVIAIHDMMMRGCYTLESRDKLKSDRDDSSKKGPASIRYHVDAQSRAILNAALSEFHEGFRLQQLWQANGEGKVQTVYFDTLDIMSRMESVRSLLGLAPIL